MPSPAPNPFMRGIRQRWPFAEPPLAVQAEALKRCAGRGQYAYFLEMGLGKTRLVLAEAELLYGAGEISNVMVVLPNSLKGTWAAEAETVKSSFTVVTWPEAPPENPEHCLFLINYEALLAKGGKVAWKFIEHKTMLVLDESARVKNPKALSTKTVLGLSYARKYIRLLSGLPAPQNVLDYWSQLKILDANVHRHWVPFRMKYCKMGGYMDRQIVGAVPEHEEELSRIIESVSFRATKREWTDLPEKMYTSRSYELAPGQRAAYGQMLREFVIWLEEGKAVTAPLAVTQLLKLAQISSGFVIDGEGRAVDLVPPKSNPKLDLLEEVLEETSGKVIVFAVFKHTLELAKARWPDAPIIEGSMPTLAITENVRRFNDSDAKLIVCQVTSAKYGLTLLGNPGMPCHTVAYLENSYSLDARAQSEDRCHRHGQKNPVLYVDLLGTRVERAALAILARKQDLSEAILDRRSPLRKALEAGI